MTLHPLGLGWWMLTAVPLIFSCQDWLMLCRRNTRWARGSCGWFCFIFVVIGEGKKGADVFVVGSGMARLTGHFTASAGVD